MEIPSPSDRLDDFVRSFSGEFADALDDYLEGRRDHRRSLRPTRNVRRKLVPYRESELVRVEEPGRGSRFDVGTVVLRVSGGQERLVAIVAPHEVARIIEQGRKAVANVQRSAV